MSICVEEFLLRTDTCDFFAGPCMFGARSPDEGILLKKPSRFMRGNPNDNPDALCDRLMKRCDGSREHDDLLRKVDGIALSWLAGRYSEGLIRAMVQGFFEDWDMALNRPICSVLAGNLDEEANDMADGPSEGEDPQAAPEGPCPMLQSESEDEDRVFDVRQKRVVKGRILRILHRLHINYGHPDLRDFLRILRTNGASESVLEKARKFDCKACRRYKKPKIRRPTATPRPRRFNEAVGIDVVEAPGLSKDKPVKYLNCTDWATGLIRVCKIKNEEANASRKAYRRAWLRRFGRPWKLVADQHDECIGIVAKRARIDGTLICRSSTDAPCQNSRTERRGGLCCDCYTKIVAEVVPKDSDELEKCAVQAQNAVCSLGRRGRYISGMLVFEYEFPLSGSLTDVDQAEHRHIHSQYESDDTMQRAFAIRSAARRAMIELETASKTRQVMVSAPRAFRGPFLQGEAVMVWRRAKADGKKHGEPCWDGPGIVQVDSTADTVWVDIDGGGLIKVAPEAVRLATDDEIEGFRPVLRSLREWGPGHRFRSVEEISFSPALRPDGDRTEITQVRSR